VLRDVYSRDGKVCQMCGATPDDVDPFDRAFVRHTVGFFIAPEAGGEISMKNLRVICTSCFEGLQKIALPKPDRIHLLSQIRRATIDDQQAVLDWLLTKFGLIAGKKNEV
jgi:hypothetical protein